MRRIIIAKLHNVTGIMNRFTAVLNRRAEIFTMIEPFRVNVVDVNLENVTIQLTGDSAKIEALIDVVSPYGILNMARTGSAGFERG